MHNLFLIGFMGCGKTRVGRLVAQAAGRPFFDMDVYIEQIAGCSVADVFSRFGEERFRGLEREACQALAQQKGCVIACGGGAVMDSRNMDVLRASGLLFYLSATPETVCLRLKDDRSRPLLNVPDREERVRRLLSERRPLYERAADRTIGADGSPLQTANAVLAALPDGYWPRP